MPTITTLNENNIQRIKAGLVSATNMPMAVTELVVNYMGSACQFMQAQQLLNFGHKGYLVNPGIRLAIKEALISNYCSLEIKRQIFVNLASVEGDAYRVEMNQIFREIHQVGYVINLDFTDLSHLKLSGLNFPPGTSCQHINLVMTEIYGSSMPAVDLTHANCRQTVLRLVDLSAAKLRCSTWTAATLTRVNLSKTTGVNLDSVKQLTRVNLDEATDDDLTGPALVGQRYQKQNGLSLLIPLNFDDFVGED